MRLVYVVVVSVLVLAAPAATSDRVVETLSGAVRGRLVRDLNVTYYAYLGIPYAEAPTGQLRFKPPVPKEPWNGTLDATAYGPVCPQDDRYHTRSEMSEDCLSLNVYVPARPALAPTPVLVYVPGGDLQRCSGRPVIYGPQFFMKYGVMCVTMNYRLGALGFLSVQTEDAAGNAALKDILLSLQWVKRHIAQFGGDPDNVTVGGESAGAVLVQYLTLSERSTNLFHKASIISGSALGYRFFNRHPIKTALDLGKKMGFQTKDPNELVRKLQEADVFDIVTAQGDKTNKRNGFRPFEPLTPVAEAPSPHAVITQHPLEIVKQGIPQAVPIIVGITTHEGIKMLPFIRRNPILALNLNEDFELCIPSDIEYPYGSRESQDLANSIKQFYFNNETISNTTLLNFVNLVSDTQVTYSTDRWIEIYKNMANSDRVYYFVFDFDGDLNWYKLFSKTQFPGASHADHLGYMFVTNTTRPLLPSAGTESKETVQVVLQLWTNFIKYGNPSRLTWLTCNIREEWSDCGTQRNYLALNNRPYMVPGPPLRRRLHFWRQVYAQYESYVDRGGRLEAKTP
ncbi:unnamed protein product [Plutella xylostella]|uniref:Carboxylic ester hydrolase n=1 Tax=Plutella xylostella TaxID=51655 RepID=A0A8S4DNZ5_PLUXY|nr:unnamed protein product [Plutella xylostella]